MYNLFLDIQLNLFLDRQLNLFLDRQLNIVYTLQYFHTLVYELVVFMN